MASCTMLANSTPNAVAKASTETAREARRNALFRETAFETARRWALGLGYALVPSRAPDVPFLLAAMAKDLLRGGTRIPHTSRTHDRPDTFAGVCRDLSSETILEAGRGGFYPFCHLGPLKWWTRKERMVLQFPDHHIAKRFRSIMKKSPWRVTFDTAFDDVIKACSEPRSNRGHALTWITPRIMRLYSALHDMGHAHSVEVWDEEGRLIGGCYGLAVGRTFVTESQFFREPNASKLGYHMLNHHLAKWGYVLNDNKGYTETTAAMGFKLVPRAEFESLLAEHAHAGGRIGKWSVEDSVADVAGAQKAPAAATPQPSEAA